MTNASKASVLVLETRCGTGEIGLKKERKDVKKKRGREEKRREERLRRRENGIEEGKGKGAEHLGSGSGSDSPRFGGFGGFSEFGFVGSGSSPSARQLM